VHAECSHWLHEISISKTVGHHFWPGLIAREKNWGQRKKEKKTSPPPPPPTPKLKRKKFKALRVHAEPSHWLHEISISKLFLTIFDLGSYPHYKLGVLICHSVLILKGVD
jgi:hypothetical protein